MILILFINSRKKVGNFLNENPKKQLYSDPPFQKDPLFSGIKKPLTPFRVKGFPLFINTFADTARAPKGELEYGTYPTRSLLLQ
jgi:hypothetical protein